jgi:hypothetical protein
MEFVHIKEAQYRQRMFGSFFSLTLGILKVSKLSARVSKKRRFERVFFMSFPFCPLAFL